MDSVRAFLKAFGNSYTCDPRRNPYLWFGVLWGVPVPIFSIALDLSLVGPVGRGMVDVLIEHPVHYLFLAHPLLFGLVFGAMGTVRHDLELRNRALIDKLTVLAMTDSLTGVYNRRYALEELRNALHRAGRSRDPLSVILFDIDDFKAVNDERGHLAGDEALQSVASSLRSVLRRGEILGRYGGDEFLLIVPGDLPCALCLVERASDAVRSASGLGVSAGVARYPEDGAAPRDLIEAADRLLAESKRKRHAPHESVAC